MQVDPRLVRVGILVNGNIKYYEGLAITASGTKTASSTENECEIKITNLSRETREYLLTETSPYTHKHYEKTTGDKTVKTTTGETATVSTKPQSPRAATVYSGVKLILEAGRVSTGYSTVYEGDVISATPSQPPNIDLTIKCATGSNAKLDIVSHSETGNAKLSNIAKKIASNLELKLIFQATDKNVLNYAFTGSASKQIGELESLGVHAFIDDGNLVVKNINGSLSGNAQLISKDTGMIGIPELTETGIKVKYLFNSISKIGSTIVVKSDLYPTANGQYTIFKLDFDIASRDNQFYITAEAKRQ